MQRVQQDGALEEGLLVQRFRGRQGQVHGQSKQKSTPTWVPKGKGKGTSVERKCWSCGETGHMSPECRKPKKAVNSLVGQRSSEEPQSHDALGGLSLSSVGKNNEYGRKDDTRVSFGIDSGAAATTLPQDWCTDYPLEKIGIGKGCYSASGEAIPDLGRRRLVVTTAGSVKAVRARVTKVRRALISVYDMCMAGHRVVFDMEDGVDMSYVLHKKTGQKIKPVEPDLGLGRGGCALRGVDGSVGEDREREQRTAGSFSAAGPSAA